MTLAEYLSREDLSLTAFAARLSVSVESVRRYRDGDRIPEKKIMEEIHRETDGAVTANDFYGLPGTADRPSVIAEPAAARSQEPPSATSSNSKDAA